MTANEMHILLFEHNKRCAMEKASVYQEISGIWLKAMQESKIYIVCVYTIILQKNILPTHTTKKKMTGFSIQKKVIEVVLL